MNRINAIIFHPNQGAKASTSSNVAKLTQPYSEIRTLGLCSIRTKIEDP
jgi:hypothetical protein